MDLRIAAFQSCRLGCVLLALGASASMIWAQANCEIRLEVKDPSGAAVKAAGTLRNLDTDSEQPFETDAQGKFDFTNLAYNRYELRISKDGFLAQTAHMNVR